MLGFSLALHHLRPNDVANTVCNENGGCRKALFRLAGHITRREGNSESDDRSKETDDRIAHHRGSWTISPFGLPDDNEACNDRQAAGDQKWDPNIAVGANPASQGNADCADGTERELEQYALKGGVAKCRHDERPEARYGPIYRVTRAAIRLKILKMVANNSRSSHHNHNQPNLHI